MSTVPLLSVQLIHGTAVAESREPYDIASFCSVLQVNKAIAAPRLCFSSAIESKKHARLETGDSADSVLREAAALDLAGSPSAARKLWRHLIVITYGHSPQWLLGYYRTGDDLQIGISDIISKKYSAGFSRFEAVARAKVVGSRFTTGFDDDRSLSDSMSAALHVAADGDYGRCVSDLIALKVDVRFDYRLLFLGACYSAEKNERMAERAWLLGSTAESSTSTPTDMVDGVQLYAVQMLLAE